MAIVVIPPLFTMQHIITLDDSIPEILGVLQQKLAQVLFKLLDSEMPDSAMDWCKFSDKSEFYIHIDAAVTALSQKQRRDIWYLYEDDLISAYDNSGVGDDPRENDGLAAIYAFIEEKLITHYVVNQERLFDEWNRPANEYNDAYKNAQEQLAASWGNSYKPAAASIQITQEEKELTNEE